MKRKFKQPLALLTTFVMTLTMLMDLPNGIFESITPKVSAAETTTITPTKPSTDSSGVYQIKTAGELYWFAGLVNGTLTGVSQNTSANAVLADDIIVNTGVLKSDGTLANDTSGFAKWFPIGYCYDLNGDESCEDIYYQGKFDGQNHTISGLYFDNSEQDIVGLFGQIQNNDENLAEIKNVGVVDSYFAARNMVGGVCGWSNGTITNIYHTGAVSGTNDVGGVCGYNNGTITNSYHIGAVSGTSSVGGVCGKNYGTITNCYFDSTVYSGNAVGINSDGTVSDSVLGKTTVQFASGEVAYLLSQGCTISGSSYTLTPNQSVDYSDLPVDDQMIGWNWADFGIPSGETVTKVEVNISTTADAIGKWQGAFGTSTTVSPEYWSETSDMQQTFSGKTGTITWNVDSDIAKVIQLSSGQLKLGIWWIDCTTFTVDSITVYTATVTYSGDTWGQTLTGDNKQDHPVLGGAKVALSDTQYVNVKQPEQITADNYGDYGFTADTYESYVGYYAISSAGELYWFAGLVNGTLAGVTQNTSANAVLTKDITVNANLLESLTYDDDGNVTNSDSFTAWFPIGYYDHPNEVCYKGKFDGQNHTISGLYFNNSAQSCVGLFGLIDGAEIKNVGVEDSYFNADGYVGGVCGANYETTITNSYHIGAVSGTADVGGVCGANYGTITNSYHIGAVSGTADVGGVCGLNGGTITNSYFDSTAYTGNAVGLNDKGTVSDSVLGKTTVQFASGEVAYLLSQGCTISGSSYTVTPNQSVNYSDLPEDDQMIGWNWAGFGISSSETVTKVEVNISTTADAIGKWQGAFGTSTTVSPEYWAETNDMQQTFSGKTGTITWNVDSDIAKVIQLSSGQLKLGIWWIDCTTFTVDSITVYTATVTYSGDTWGQTLTGDNKQDHPVLSGAKVYQVDHYHGSALFEKAYSNTSGTTYENNVNGKCTVCGHFENGIGAKLAGYTLSLSGNIGVNFYMELDVDVIADTGAYMQFALPNGTTLKVYVKDVETDTTTTAGTTYYIFPCEVAAKEMYDTITAQIMLSDGTKGEEYTFKVEDYANYILDDDNGYDEKTQDLVTAMLNYGSFAKAYFNEETLSATTEMESIAAATLSGYAFTATGTLPEGITYYGSTLILESETAIRHYFKVAEGTNISAYNMTAKDGFYYVQVFNIAADDLGVAQTTTIDEYSISYSAMSYAYAVLNGGSSDQNLINLVKALYLYDQAAVAYNTEDDTAYDFESMGGIAEQ